MPGADGHQVLKCGEHLWMVATHVPARGYDEAAIARGLQDFDWVSTRALAHEAVVEHFLSAPAVLPLQLFTLFTSDERALAYVTRHRRRIERVLGRVERQLEWGVRMMFDEPADPEAKQVPASPRRRRPAESGVAYLARKRDIRTRVHERLTRARTEGNRLYRMIAREATAARRRGTTAQDGSNARLLVDAAFLVPVKRATAFRATVRRHARTARPAGVVVSLTGPWPPYNFVERPAGRRS